MNALFLKDLAQKTRRGQRGRVEAGKIPGGNSYGYRMVRSLRDDGSVTTGEREIDQARRGSSAASSRNMRPGWRHGGSPPGSTGRASRPARRALERLHHQRQPERQNGILNNALSLGRITYNRQRFIKDPTTGRRVSRPNPEALWVTKDVRSCAPSMTRPGPRCRPSRPATARRRVTCARQRRGFFQALSAAAPAAAR